MKLPRFSLGIVSGLSLALAGQAAITTLDWQFENAGNLGDPLAPTPDGTTPGNSAFWTAPSTTSNPSGGVPAATFSGSGQSYHFGTPGLGDGSAQGTYDVASFGANVATLTLTLQSSSASPVDYVLTVVQYNQGGFPTDGLLTFSIPGAVAGGSTVLETTSHGQWERDSWSWSGLSVSGPQTLAITPTTSGNDIWFDEVQWTINGNLAAVPEPIHTQGIAAAGLLAIGIFSWRRRKVQGETPVPVC